MTKKKVVLNNGIDLSRFNGKVLKSIDDSAVNCWTLHFEDGTSLLLECENVGMGLLGLVPYIP